MHPAPIFQDHAVLQRDCPLPVWGEAAPGTSITVEIGGHSAAAVTGSDGRWITRLPALPAGGPHQLIIQAGNGTPSVTFNDILIGEVWVCSGQSNMEFTLDQTGAPSGDTELPRIRLLTVSTAAKGSLQTEIDGRWTACSQEAISKFSAVAGWFGRTLHASLGVPVGLIANAWGGTRIQAWLSREALMSDPAGRDEIAAYEPLLYSTAPLPDSTFESYDAWFRAVGPENPIDLGRRDGWHTANFDHSAWPTMDLPSRWQDGGHDFSGLFWFRRTIPIPPMWRGRDLMLHLGAIDKHDETYVNGHRIGGLAWEHLNSWCTPRHYTVPSALLGGGTHLVIAVRVRSHQYHGGLTGPAASMCIHPLNSPEARLPLAGPWHFAVEQNWGSIISPAFDGRGPGGCNAPYSMFASRLHPLIPFAIRGFIWYQGESNASEHTLYRRLLPLMIADWRRAWGQGKLPFLQVQLANYQPALDHPAESDWAGLRSAQAAALRDPQVGLAVAIDVGEAGDIHPKDKKTVGLRLARWALGGVYGHSVTPSGPLLRAVTSASGRLHVAFDHASGLSTRDGGRVSNLAIAGSDRRFHWAESRIVGEQLEVWHPDIPCPAVVRYAWADNPEGCNLINADFLPAAPFDTDDLTRA